MRDGKALVLVVDDSPSCRILARRLVLAAGYEVVVAEDADADWRRGMIGAPI